MKSPSRARYPYGGTNLYFFSPQTNTSLQLHTFIYSTAPDHGHVASAFPLHGVPVCPQLSLVLTVHTYGGMARLSCPGWLVMYENGLPICQWSSIQVQTVPGAEQLCGSNSSYTTH